MPQKNLEDKLKSLRLQVKLARETRQRELIRLETAKKRLSAIIVQPNGDEQKRISKLNRISKDKTFDVLLAQLEKVDTVSKSCLSKQSQSLLQAYSSLHGDSFFGRELIINDREGKYSPFEKWLAELENEIAHTLANRKSETQSVVVDSDAVCLRIISSDSNAGKIIFHSRCCSSVFQITLKIDCETGGGNLSFNPVLTFDTIDCALLPEESLARALRLRFWPLMQNRTKMNRDERAISEVQ
mmetsp:Transcript_13502/g.17589  ORF Transcript_13502/g.17589 Transcript_13502/m.17589 type:complete len:242 (-) Transcript_13502:37-762(-)